MVLVLPKSPLVCHSRESGNPVVFFLDSSLRRKDTLAPQWVWLKPKPASPTRGEADGFVRLNCYRNFLLHNRLESFGKSPGGSLRPREKPEKESVCPSESSASESSCFRGMCWSRNRHGLPAAAWPSGSSNWTAPAAGRSAGKSSPGPCSTDWMPIKMVVSPWKRYGAFCHAARAQMQVRPSQTPPPGSSRNRFWSGSDRNMVTSSRGRTKRKLPSSGPGNRRSRRCPMVIRRATRLDVDKCLRVSLCRDSRVSRKE